MSVQFDLIEDLMLKIEDGNVGGFEYFARTRKARDKRGKC